MPNELLQRLQERAAQYDTPVQGDVYAKDADTVDVAGRERPVRLQGVDAPERSKVIDGQFQPGEPGAEESTAILQRLLNRGPVSIEDTGQDTYNRDVGKIITGDGKDISTELVERGAAFPTRFSTPEQRGAVRTLLARTSGIGAFVDNPEARADALRMMQAFKNDPNFSFSPFKGRAGYRNGNNAFTGAVERGTDNLQASLYAASNALGEFVGVDALAAWGERGMQENMLEAAANPAQVESYEDIDGLATLGTYIAEALGEQIPNLAAMATGGGAGATIARAAMGKALLKRAALAGTAVPSYGLAVGEVQQELKEGGIDSPGTALLAGIPIAGLDVAGLDLMVGRLFKDMSVKTAKDMAKQVAQGFGVSTSGEFTTEAAQELLTMTARAMHDPEYELFSEENRKRLLNAGFKGAIVGGVLGTTSATAKAAFEFTRENSRQGSISDEGGDPNATSAPAGTSSFTPPTVGGEFRGSTVEAVSTVETGGQRQHRIRTAGGAFVVDAQGRDVPVTPVPESQQTIDAQADAVRDETSAKDSMLITPGSPEPTSTEGLGERIETPVGTVFTTDATKAEAIKQELANPQLGPDALEVLIGEILFNIQGGRPEGGDRVVVAADKKTRPVAEIVANAQTETQAIEEATRQAPEGGSVQTRAPQDVLADRQAQVNAEAFDKDVSDFAGAPVRRTLRETVSRLREGEKAGVTENVSGLTAIRAIGTALREMARLPDSTGETGNVARPPEAASELGALGRGEYGLFSPQIKRGEDPINDANRELFEQEYPAGSPQRERLANGYKMVRTLINEFTTQAGIDPINIHVMMEGSANGVALVNANDIGLSRERLEALGDALMTRPKSLRARTRAAAAVETAYHELGHMLQARLLSVADEASVDEILNDFNQWVQKRSGSSTLLTQISRKGLANKVEFLATLAGYKKPETAAPDAFYSVQFGEWWADQVAKYMSARLANKEVVGVPKAVRDFGEMLLNLYEALKVKLGVAGLPAPSVKKFLDNHLAEVRQNGPKVAKPRLKSQSQVMRDTGVRARSEEVAPAQDTQTVSFTVETAAARIAIERAFPNAKVEGPVGGPWTVTEELPPNQVRGDDVDSSAARQALAKALDDGRRTQNKRLEFIDTNRPTKDGKNPKVRVNAQELVNLGRQVDDTPIGGDLTDIGHIRDKMLAAMSYLADLGLVPAGQYLHETRGRLGGREVTGIPNSTVVYTTNTGADITWGQLMNSQRRKDVRPVDDDIEHRAQAKEFDREEEAARMKKADEVKPVLGSRKAFNPAPATDKAPPQGQKRTPDHMTFDEASEADQVAEKDALKREAQVSASERRTRSHPGAKYNASKANRILHPKSGSNVGLLAKSLGKKGAELVDGLLKHIGLQNKVFVADEAGVVTLIEDLKAQRQALRTEYRAAKDDAQRTKIAERGAEINAQISAYEDILRESPAARIVYNDAAKDARNRVPLIFISENVKGKRAQVLHLAHELGHLVQRAALDTAPKEVQDALREALGTEHFAENFANQLIKWVDRRTPARNIVDKFFKGLRDRLHDLWFYLRTTNGYKLDKTFGEFMDSLVVLRTQRQGGQAATVLGRRFVKHMENFVTGPYLPHRLDGEAQHDASFTLPPSVARAGQYVASTRRGHKLLSVGKNSAAILKAALDYGIRSNDAFLRGTGSATAAWIADQWHKRAGDVKRAMTIPEEIRRFMGPFHEQINAIVDMLPKRKALRFFDEVDVDSAEYQELRTLLQNQTSEADFAARGDAVGRAGVAIRQFFDSVHDEMTGPKYGVKINRRANYFPLIVDMNKWMHRKHDVIARLTSQGVSRIDAEEFYQYIVKVNGAAMDSMSVADETLAPGFRFKKRHQYLDLLKDEFMVDDIHTAMAFYLHAAARRSVIESRFRMSEEDAIKHANDLKRLNINAANPVAGLQFKLARAFEHGELNAEQYRHIKNNILEGNFGRLGATANPLLKRFSAAVVLYQNFRLLSMAVLTSLVDPGQTLWRSDMNFRANIKAFRDTVLNPTKREELYRMARLIGTIQDDVTDHVLNDQMNTQFLGPDIRKWNERFFRAILMHQWTNITRVMAMSVGRDYILDHGQKAAQGNQDSVRRLQELGVNAEQVQRWVAGQQSLTGHDAVVSAINTFVDEAIIRPEASIRPWWGSDPRFMLVFHLKSFMWAYHEQILRRLWQETKNKPALMKAIPMLGLMAATMPLAMLGYETRRHISWWGNPPKHTEKDGWEYFQELAERSGYLGIFQLYVDADQAEEFGKFSLLSILGPSADQFGEFVSKDLDYFMLRATPFLAQSGAARAWIREQ